MADNPRSYPRDVRGRFSKIDPERDVLAPGLGVPEKFAYGLTPRHAPDADDLAQGGQQRPLQPRTARLVSGGDERMVGEPNSWPQMRRLDPVPVHPDDAVHPVFGVQGAALRTAARGAGPMDPSYELVTGFIPARSAEGNEDE